MEWFRASEIYTVPAREARKGLLPLQRAQFYQLLREGKFPAPDGVIGNSKVWSDELIKESVAKLNDQLPDQEQQD